MPKISDLTNQVFGRLTVISRYPENTPAAGVQWNCVCNCENKTILVVSAASLKSGNTRSCGCLRKDAVGAANTKHGFSYLPEYRIWEAMKQRCYNKKNRFYSHYGARGITVCDEWLNSFEIFYRDMGPRSSQKHSLNRKDNDGNYEPMNCCWSNDEEQANNRSNNLIYEIDGVKKSLSAWCRELNLVLYKVYGRLRLGWSFEEAIGRKDRLKKIMQITYDGTAKPLTHWCDLFVLDYGVTRCRILAGEKFEDIVLE